jgi:hypothetical protein
MFIVSSIVLAGLVAAAVVTRRAQESFKEFRALPYLPQEL